MVMPGLGVRTEDVAALQTLLESHALLRREQEFKLSSGRQSKYYFNAKPVTLSAEGLELVGRTMGPFALRVGADAVGGLEIGAIPIALAIAAWSRQAATEIPAFIVRDAQKRHGTEELIAESYLWGEPRNSRVVIVDDVVTTGKSVQQAIDAVVGNGCEVLSVVTLVTRPEEGGVGEMRRRFSENYISIFECDMEGNLNPLINEFVAAPTA